MGGGLLAEQLEEGLAGDRRPAVEVGARVQAVAHGEAQRVRAARPPANEEEAAFEAWREERAREVGR